MYHFFTFALWTLFFVIVTISKGFVSDPDFHTALVAFQFIFLGIFTINFVIFFFNQLNGHEEFIKQINGIRSSKKKLSIIQEKFDTLKKYYEETLMKLYPDHEKEIFEKIVNSRPKDLSVLLEAYPELKSSVVINDLFENIKKELDELYHKKDKIEDKIQDLKDLKNNPWYLRMPEIPSDIC